MKQGCKSGFGECTNTTQGFREPVCLLTTWVYIGASVRVSSLGVKVLRFCQ